MVVYFACLTTLKLWLGQISTKPNISIWGVSGFVVCCSRPHLNLTRWYSFVMLHLLPCLTTFNIVEYLTGRVLNNWRGVSSICNSLHIELHLICSVVCCTLPCHVHVVVVYYVVCFFSVLLLRVGCVNVAFVRIRSSTSVCLLHGLVLLPCGISGKMTIPSKSLLSLLASCRSFAMPMLRYLPLAYHASHIVEPSL